MVLDGESNQAISTDPGDPPASAPGVAQSCPASRDRDSGVILARVIRAGGPASSSRCLTEEADDLLDSVKRLIRPRDRVR